VAAAGPPPVTPLGRSELRRVVIVLCFTQIISWGVLFYAFLVLATSISSEQGWPLTRLTAVFTMALLVAAAAGVWVGRHLDRHGPRRVMTAGSVLGVVSTVAMALAPDLAFFAGAWVLAGLAMSATLYPPAFATVTHWAGSQRVKALTAITLVAGFASTAFAPITALLVTHGGWRQTYLILAIILAVTAPVHWWGLNRPWQTGVRPGAPHLSNDPSGTPAPDAGRASVIRRPEFLMLTAAFTLTGICVYAVVVNLVPLLTQNGLTTSEAAIALGIGGAGQVAGRLLYGPVITKVAVRARTVGILSAASLTTVVLAVSAGSLLLSSITAFTAGMARGLFTLVQATAVSDRWGTHRFGARNSVLSGGVTAASALAPWAGAALAAWLGDYRTAFLVLAAGAGLAVLLVRPGEAAKEKLESSYGQCEATGSSDADR
jgi:MFS family permease